MSNFEYLITRPGILKLATIVLGIVIFTLSSFAYTKSPYTEFYSNRTELDLGKDLPGTELELYQLIITGVLLSLSIAYLVLYAFIYELCESSFNRLVDTAYHMVSALLLFAGGCFYFYSAIEIEGYGCEMFGLSPTPRLFDQFLSSEAKEACHHFEEKILSAGFSIFNAVVYCITGIIIFTTKEL